MRRLPRHWRERTLSPTPAWSSQLPCLGVECTAKRHPRAWPFIWPKVSVSVFSQGEWVVPDQVERARPWVGVSDVLAGAGSAVGHGLHAVASGARLHAVEEVGAALVYGLVTPRPARPPSAAGTLGEARNAELSPPWPPEPPAALSIAGGPREVASRRVTPTASRAAHPVAARCPSARARRGAAQAPLPGSASRGTAPSLVWCPAPGSPAPSAVPRPATAAPAPA